MLTGVLHGCALFHQVGSKNAAFFMGRCIKVASRQRRDPFVHELAIGAQELEQRYREAQVAARTGMPFPGLTTARIGLSPRVSTGLVSRLQRADACLTALDSLDTSWHSLQAACLAHKIDCMGPVGA
jgi:hypothetical protein